MTGRRRRLQSNRGRSEKDCGLKKKMLQKSGKHGDSAVAVAAAAAAVAAAALAAGGGGHEAGGGHHPAQLSTAHGRQPHRQEERGLHRRPGGDQVCRDTPQHGVSHDRGLLWWRHRSVLPDILFFSTVRCQAKLEKTSGKQKSVLLHKDAESLLVAFFNY